MKWVLGHGDGLKPALRSIDRGMPGSVSPILLAQRREALYDAIRQAQAFMHMYIYLFLLNIFWLILFSFF